MSVSPYLRLVPRSFAQVHEARQRQHQLDDFMKDEYDNAKKAIEELRRAAIWGLSDDANADVLNMLEDIESTFNARRTELESAITGIGE